MEIRYRCSEGVESAGGDTDLLSIGPVVRWGTSYEFHASTVGVTVRTRDQEFSINRV